MDMCLTYMVAYGTVIDRYILILLWPRFWLESDVSDLLWVFHPVLLFLIESLLLSDFYILAVNGLALGKNWRNMGIRRLFSGFVNPAKCTPRQKRLATLDKWLLDGDFCRSSASRPRAVTKQMEGENGVRTLVYITTLYRGHYASVGNYQS